MSIVMSMGKQIFCGRFTLALFMPEISILLLTSRGKDLDIDQTALVRALLEGAVLCNDSSLVYDGKSTFTPVGAPTEVALITAGLKAGLKAEDLKKAAPRVASVPFESEHKFMATVHAPSR